MSISSRNHLSNMLKFFKSQLDFSLEASALCFTYLVLTIPCKGSHSTISFLVNHFVWCYSGIWKDVIGHQFSKTKGISTYVICMQIKTTIPLSGHTLLCDDFFMANKKLPVGNCGSSKASSIVTYYIVLFFS